MLIYFWSDGSGQCSRMYGETMSQKAVIDEMDEFVCFSANTADSNAYKLVERYNVQMLPTVLDRPASGQCRRRRDGLHPSRLLRGGAAAHPQR